MQKLLIGIAIIVVVGVAGVIYRNAVEHPYKPITCPVDKLACPDGTYVERQGMSCEFALCPAPNVTLTSTRISFAVPAGFVAASTSDPTTLAQYDAPPEGTSTESASITIRHYPIDASSTALMVIHQTAFDTTSGQPVNPTRFTAKTINDRTFTIAPIERFEGVIITAYYLAHGNEVLRFEAIDRGADWTNPHLNVFTLPAHAALEKLLSTLQGQ